MLARVTRSPTLPYLIQQIRFIQNTISLQFHCGMIHAPSLHLVILFISSVSWCKSLSSKSRYIVVKYESLQHATACSKEKKEDIILDNILRGKRSSGSEHPHHYVFLQSKAIANLQRCSASRLDIAIRTFQILAPLLLWNFAESTDFNHSHTPITLSDQLCMY